MKKLISTVAAIALLSTAAMAEDTTKTNSLGAILGVGSYGFVAGLDYNMDLTSMTGDMAGGKIGAEVTFLYDMGTSTDYSYYTSSQDAWGMGFLGTYTYPVAANQSVKIGLGLSYSAYNYTWTDSGTSSYFNYDSDFSVSSIGVAYNVSYDYSLGDAGTISAIYSGMTYVATYGVAYSYAF